MQNKKDQFAYPIGHAPLQGRWPEQGEGVVGWVVGDSLPRSLSILKLLLCTSHCGIEFVLPLPLLVVDGPGFCPSYFILYIANQTKVFVAYDFLYKNS